MNKIDTIVADHICLQLSTGALKSPMKQATFFYMESKYGKEFMEENTEMYGDMFDGGNDTSGVVAEDMRLRREIDKNSKAFDKLLGKISVAISNGDIEKYMKSIK